MTYIDDLITTRDNIASLMASITANPKPNYSIDGQTVAWGDYLEMLREQLKGLNEAIAAGEPFEYQTRACT